MRWHIMLSFFFAIYSFGVNAESVNIDGLYYELSGSSATVVYQTTTTSRYNKCI